MSEQREQFRRRVEELVALFKGMGDRRNGSLEGTPKRLRDDDREVSEVPALFLAEGPYQAAP